MKLRVADFIAQLLTENGIKDVFSVVGGGAMHLNDAFGNCEGLHVTYNHHEQGSAIAAEGYARVHGKPAVACVTTGPGGTNAITGVLCAWQDNIPMLVISGQVRYDTTVESTGLDLRQFGEQEHYIVDTVRSMTKYAVMIKDANTVRFHVEKALYLASQGRRGPCWLDVPLNIQGAIIETDEQEGFAPPESTGTKFSKDRVLRMLRAAKRPVILAGSAVRVPGIYEQFKTFAHSAGIPVLAATSNADILPLNDSIYYGNFGVFGGRAGNFITENADCLLVLGCRLAFKHTGFNYKMFAPNAKKIVVDVDINELKKETTKIDLPICADLADFFDRIPGTALDLHMDPEWVSYCITLRDRFPVYLDKYNTGCSVNAYYFGERLKRLLPEDAITVVGNSCSCVSLLQGGVLTDRQRMWGNVNCGTMGYDLPAALGAAVAAKGTVICATGDGSIQMNIQELQTVVSNCLPVKIVIFNNGGYNAIVQTQSNFFCRLSGCTPDSGLGIPNFQRLSEAYGIPYFRCESNVSVDSVLEAFLRADGFGLCEVIEDCSQTIEPKLKSKKLPDGQMVSPPICDLAPFLDADEYARYSSFEAHAWKATKDDGMEPA